MRELGECVRRLRAVAVTVPDEHERARWDPGAEGERLHGAVARIDHELRLDRGAEILGDERAQRAVVVGTEDDVELRNAAGEKPLGLVGRAPPDQRQLGDLAQRRRRLELRELGSGRDEQDVGILK